MEDKEFTILPGPSQESKVYDISELPFEYKGATLVVKQNDRGLYSPYFRFSDGHEEFIPGIGSLEIRISAEEHQLPVIKLELIDFNWKTLKSC